MYKHSRPLIVTLFSLILCACHDETLLSHLTQQQANQVLSVLQRNNIVAQKDGSFKEGYTVTVNKSEDTAALSIINQYQLPWAAEVQIAQAFPTNSMVASPGSEQARVLSLQEQRLEQSLRMISQVANVSVNVSYLPFNDDTTYQKPETHVGVLITYEGHIDDDLFISQVKSLIKNSFNDVRYDNISVVLFPAPKIQYAPPTQLSTPISVLWTSIIFGLVLCLAFAAGYILYKFKFQSPENKQKTLIQEDEEPIEL
ncbi:type III secretion protein J [Izhakiella capsodis]|uniref:Lipoprotein n=1 Tax=Izhakiella capsodis TaxID=1367852 RepID=A0A1I5AVC8_9GAMM|nr:type III secretion inner membrane ring lipoprotein SctJ [Izhakiella capsodis]SFN66159.1 type III secretion protein J [Izhakiella capsodis]